eukprot:gene5015-35953_t
MYCARSLRQQHEADCGRPSAHLDLLERAATGDGAGSIVQRAARGTSVRQRGADHPLPSSGVMDRM